MRQQDFVVLVDEYGHDRFNSNGRLCTIEKIEAHRRGLLHRAVSVFVFNNRNELLLAPFVENRNNPRNLKWARFTLS